MFFTDHTRDTMAEDERFTQIPSGYIKDFLLGQRVARSIRDANPDDGVLKDLVSSH